MPETTYSYSASIDDTSYLIGVIETNGILDTAGVTIISYSSLQPNQIDITLSDALDSEDKEVFDVIIGSYMYAIVFNLTDFENGFDLQHFKNSIEENETIAANILYIGQSSTVVHVNFDAEISEGEQTALDSLVSNHIAPEISEFNEDFIGSTFNPIWETNLIGAGTDVSIISGEGGLAQIDTGSDNASETEIILSTLQYSVSNRAGFEIRMRLNSTSGLYFSILFENSDSSDSIYMIYDSDIDAYWHVGNKNDDTTSDADSTILATTDWVKLKVVTTTLNTKFYINNVLTNTISTNIPDALMNFRISAMNRTASSKTIDIDWVNLTTNRLS